MAFQWHAWLGRLQLKFRRQLPPNNSFKPNRFAVRLNSGVSTQTMRSFALILLVLFCGCSESEQVPQQTPQAPHVIIADYVHSAFGGKLLGTDRGEWTGELLFQDGTGGVERILHENVQGIVENHAGIFVFTGLHHMGTNVGYIYTITLTSNNDVVATRLGSIPGAPSDVIQHPDGTASFLVATEHYDLKGRAVYDCYELAGKLVKHSLGCLPPNSLGANNSFKPNPLRGSP